MPNIITLMLKPILSRYIYSKPFDFLEGRLIHEAFNSTQEGIHSIRNSHIPVVVINIDLEKSYDMVSWLCLRLILLHLGFTLPLVKWIMGCVTSANFSTLINGLSSSYFKTSQGLT
jgi:hypothetical protein